MEFLLLNYLPILLMILITLGSFAVQNRPNAIFGIRIDYTMNYPEIWTKTHRLAGITGIPCTALAIAVSRLTSGAAMTALIWGIFILSNAIPTIYALLCGAALERRERLWEEEERRKAEQEEQ